MFWSKCWSLVTSDNNQLIDRLKGIDRANDASRERLRNLKEDMINLNVKVDNITEKLIMDRLGLMDGESSSSSGLTHDEKRLKKIEDDLEKIKFYTVKNFRLLDGAVRVQQHKRASFIMFSPNLQICSACSPP